MSPLAFTLKKTWAGSAPQWIVVHPAGFGVESFGEADYELARWDAEHRSSRAEETCRIWGIPPNEFVAVAARRFDEFLLTQRGDAA